MIEAYVCLSDKIGNIKAALGTHGSNDSRYVYISLNGEEMRKLGAWLLKAAEVVDACKELKDLYL